MPTVPPEPHTAPLDRIREPADACPSGARS
jgi:hypothetical protein